MRLGSHQIWLPESDAHQNHFRLPFEFPFGVLNIRKGEKRLLSRECFMEAAKLRFWRERPKTSQERLRLAKECKQLLDELPALTRKRLAAQLGISTARLNQILSLLELDPSEPKGEGPA